jgi:hypothetical protein
MRRNSDTTVLQVRWFRIRGVEVSEKQWTECVIGVYIQTVGGSKGCCERKAAEPRCGKVDQADKKQAEKLDQG